MKIAGSATLAADPQQVWDAFHDPAVLARCLPGCERLTELGPDHYAMTVTAGVAAIKGTYDGEVSLRNPNHPDSFTLKASGAGAPGTVDADVVVRLAPAAAGGTELRYDADASVGGVIGGVGQRMLAGVTKKMAGQFFSAVDADISGVRRAAPSAPQGGLGAVADGIPAGPSAGAPVASSPLAYAGRPAPATPLGGPGFAVGVAAGGALALVGVVVGWAIGRR